MSNGNGIITTAATFTVILIVGFAVYCGITWIGMTAWNYFMPMIFGLTTLSFWQYAGFSLFLCWCLNGAGGSNFHLSRISNNLKKLVDSKGK